MQLVDGDHCDESPYHCTKTYSNPAAGESMCVAYDSASSCSRKTHARFCIDTFEYPNAKGELPVVMKDLREAQHLCAAKGKRLCTESEWTTACEGKSFKPYPYGFTKDDTTCRGDEKYIEPHTKDLESTDLATRASEAQRLWQGSPSGAYPQCVSEYGVYDMSGNVDEIAAADLQVEAESMPEVVTMGGSWLKSSAKECRPGNHTHRNGYAYYDAGFRCCAEADGHPTDPRTPKQIAHGEKWVP
jgi:formylglycine-generating enzyme required for sulfatase activity